MLMPGQPGWETSEIDPFHNVSLAARIGAIACLYYHQPDEYGNAMHIVDLAPSLVVGDTEEFDKDDWLLIWDALGSYPHRDATLEQIYRLAFDGWRKKLSGPTPCFDPNFRDDDDDDDDWTELDGSDDVDPALN